MINIPTLKKTISGLKYVWFEDQMNLIGIRSRLQAPDVYNDIMCCVYKENGEEKLYLATFTSEPGVYYQKHLLNPKGCWIMMPAQMINAYKAGFHQNKPDHRCLQSVGSIYGLRDNDKDGVVLNNPNAKPFWEKGYLVGANIHGALLKNKTTGQIIDKSAIVGQWSAGCQVIDRWSKKEELMDIADKYKNVNKGLITYTLVNEENLIFC